MFCDNIKSNLRLNVKTNVQIFPDVSDRDFWDTLPLATLEKFEKMAEDYDPKTRGMLTASLYRKFVLDGDRTEYQKVYFGRRGELIVKTILECHYNDGRYMEDIVDLVWMILEETTWTVPAHNRYSKGSDSLPVSEINYIDLFSAETACVMAFVYQVIGRKLDEVSVNITNRIKQRTDHMVDLYINHEDFWWMAFYEGKRANNWNTWISSSMIATAFIIVDDEEKLRKFTYKALRVLDRYITPYPLDGACDEGASYWGHAGLSLMECLWMLKIGTDGQLDFFGEEKIKNTLEFFMKMYISDSEIYNFADAPSKIATNFATIYKIAKVSENENIMAFAKMLYDTVEKNKVFIPAENKSQLLRTGERCNPLRAFDILKFTPEIAKMQKTEVKASADYYLESTQVLTSRAEMNARKGIFLGAKGGHNGEHHNHNDVGSFIVYKNGTKFLVDSGPMTYRKETFGELRYTLWTTRGAYHNIPVINGIEQKEGTEFAAKNVIYENKDGKVKFSLDIGRAYPTDIIEKWIRTIEYDKPGQVITVSEDFDLEKECDISLNFMTPQRTEKEGTTLKLFADSGESLEMKFDSEFDFMEETVLTDDAAILKAWNGPLFRISFKFKEKKNKITYVIK